MPCAMCHAPFPICCRRLDKSSRGRAPSLQLADLPVATHSTPWTCSASNVCFWIGLDEDGERRLPFTCWGYLRRPPALFIIHAAEEGDRLTGRTMPLQLRSPGKSKQVGGIIHEPRTYWTLGTQYGVSGAESVPEPNQQKRTGPQHVKFKNGVHEMHEMVG